MSTARTPLTPEVVAEGVEHFKTLLRFDTTNPPGNEAPAIAWIAERLAEVGVEATIIEPAPGRANLVARIPGGSEPALLLTGHVDVVPAEPEHWSADPFAAEERDGWIYGRGAVDMKHHVAMCLTVARELRRRGLTLNRDVVLVFVADEEMGSRHGMRWLVAEHGDLLTAGYGLNEIGGFPVYLPGNRVAYAVQVAERGFAWLRLRARGEPGHGSIPPPDSAVAKLARAVDRLAHRSLPYRKPPESDRFLAALARAMGPAGVVVQALRSPVTAGWALRILPDAEQARLMRAILHNTAVPTVLRAGSKTNVVPGEAYAEVDGRYLPGCSLEEFLAEVRALVGPEIEIELLEHGPPGTAPIETPLYELIGEVVAERTDGAPILPTVVTGFTDSKWLSELGVTMYGFSPVQVPRGVRFTELFHAHDERLPRAGFEWGLETLWQTVARFVTEREG